MNVDDSEARLYRLLILAFLFLAGVIGVIGVQQYRTMSESYATKRLAEVRSRTEGFALAQETLIRLRLEDVDRRLSRFTRDGLSSPQTLNLLQSFYDEISAVRLLERSGGPGLEVAGPTGELVLWHPVQSEAADAPPTRQVLAVVINAEKLADALNVAAWVEGASVALVSQSGQVLFRRPQRPPGAGPERMDLALDLAGAPGSFTRTFQDHSPLDGVPRIVSTRQITPWPLVGVVTENLEPILQDIQVYRRGLRRRGVLTGLSLLLLIGGIVLLLHRHLISSRLLKERSRETRAAEAALREREERYRLLADNSSDVIWVFDPQQDRHTYVSPAVERLRGYTVEEVMQQTLEDTLTPASAVVAREDVRRVMAAIAAGEPFPEFRGDMEQPCKDGTTVWVEMHTAGLYDSGGEFRGILGHTRDISDRRRVEAAFRHLAQHDPLTGLPNRALVSDRLHQAITLAGRTGKSLALLFIDLDDFKSINDTQGHAVGDQVLVAITHRLREAVRTSDTVGRVGGDEFIVLLPVVDGAEAAREVADKIAHAVTRIVEYQGQTFTVSASIGIALYPDHGRNEAELTGAADHAMYQAKQTGRNRVVLFTAG